MYKVHDPIKIKDLPVGPRNDMTGPQLWFNSAMKQMVGGGISYRRNIPYNGRRYQV